MNPELRIFAENKVCDVIDNIKTMGECGKASKVIDAFEDISDDKKTTQGFRDYLCDKTFYLYNKKYNKN